MARVRFLVDTVHPDYGYVLKGEVVSVDRAYVKDYEDLKIAEETDDDLTRERGAANDEKPKGWGRYELPASEEPAGGTV